MKDLLIVEDDPTLGEGIRLALQAPELRPQLCRSLADAGELLSRRSFDLLILDLNLPGMDGLDLLRAVRAEQPELRVLILSARAQLSDKVAGLDLGADDYLTKPFALEELEAAEAAAKKAALPAVEVEPQLTEKVDFDTFCKSDFRAVKVKACDAVKKSEKLLRFTLDDGTGVDRQILSGIHKWYEPEDLVGKTLIAIVNLPPRKMMGLESNGMLISAVHTEHGEECLHLIMVDDSIPAGAKLC